MILVGPLQLRIFHDSMTPAASCGGRGVPVLWKTGLSQLQESPPATPWFYPSGCRAGAIFLRLIPPQIRRWLKFEEDVEDGGERWSKPYVATLSLHSLFELRSCIINGTVLLDVRANSVEDIAGTGGASLPGNPAPGMGVSSCPHGVSGIRVGFGCAALAGNVGSIGKRFLGLESDWRKYCSKKRIFCSKRGMFCSKKENVLHIFECFRTRLFSSP